MKGADSGVSELDEKLNTLLSDPARMSQVMQLAQQLSGSFGGATDTTPPPPPSQSAPQSAPTLFDGMDIASIMRFLPLIQELNHPNQQTAQLLNALRPFLNPEKQEKIPRAIQLARLIHIGKKVLTEMGGLGNV